MLHIGGKTLAGIFISYKIVFHLCVIFTSCVSQSFDVNISENFSVICGLTEETSKGQIVRATMEAVCFQTRDILEAMNKDCGIPLSKLLVDGGMTSNNILMQLQADLCGIPVGMLISAEFLQSLARVKTVLVRPKVQLCSIYSVKVFYQFITFHSLLPKLQLSPTIPTICIVWCTQVK